MTIPIRCKDRSAYKSATLPASVISQMHDAKEMAVDSLLRGRPYSNIVGVGMGRKVVDQKATDIRCLRIYVQSKRERDYVSPAAFVPECFGGIKTDIIEVGLLGRAGKPGQTRDNEPGKGVGPGSSIRLKTIRPNVDQGAGGTLGAVVKDAHNNNYILSCNHVLAVNGRVPLEGASIVTPALSNTPHKIADPSKWFIPLEDGTSNCVDCAIVPAGNDVVPNFRTTTLDAKDPIGEADRGQKVQKDGAVTGLTHGTIVDLNADLFVQYRFGAFLLRDQIIIDGGDGNDFAADGDSGTVVVNAEHQAVGLVFAEAGRFAVACPLADVFEQLSALVGSTLVLA